jgi:hypothetical protein
LLAVADGDVPKWQSSSTSPKHFEDWRARLKGSPIHYPRSVDRAQKLVMEYESRLGADHPQTLTAQVELARSYRANGELLMAERVLDTAVPALTQTLGTENAEVLRARQLYTRVLAVLGQPDDMT